MTDLLQSPYWLAPLTKGGHVAFRRLCVGEGAGVTVGEMALARRLRQRRGRDLALLYSHRDEPCFGAQIADRNPESLAKGAQLAEERGARFVDLNCGCPIYEITGRGLGAGLLKKPGRLGRLVEAMRRAVTIPVTVKLRTGWTEDKPKVSELARVCEESGASAVTIHGRSREQRYSRAADWEVIGRVAAERGILVVGNGDVLTHYEARDRMQRYGVRAVMVGRGALIKPWIFRELREGRSWLPSAEERLELLWRFVELMRERFGTDGRGRERILGLLPWHLDFLCRYRPLPESEYLERSREHPLIQTRWTVAPDLPPLERLLADPRPETHGALAEALVDASELGEASVRAMELASGLTAVPGEEPDEDAATSSLVAG